MLAGDHQPKQVLSQEAGEETLRKERGQKSAAAISEHSVGQPKGGGQATALGTAVEMQGQKMSQSHEIPPEYHPASPGRR